MTEIPIEPEPEGEAFVRGFEQAERDFFGPHGFIADNPFPEGTEEHRGYEEAIYVFTQK